LERNKQTKNSYQYFTHEDQLNFFTKEEKKTLSNFEKQIFVGGHMVRQKRKNLIRKRIYFVRQT